jgi:SM-20-related protein
VVEDFLDPPFLVDLLPELQVAHQRTAAFYQVATGWKVNEEMRRAKWLGPSTDTRSRLKARLLELKPRVERHFDRTLTAFEEPQFLRYETGDYMRLHVDTDSHPDVDEELREQKVSVIMFFNDQVSDSRPGTYSGGSLVFRVALKPPQGVFTLPFPTQAGMLVAFSSRIPHEVQAVTGGSRYSAVTWYR